jgi:hypothetical protein
MTEDIWNEAPRADKVEQLTQMALNPPDEVEISVKLTGLSAARYHFARALLMSSFNLSQDEVDAYLVRCGAEREIEKILQAAQYTGTQENKN